MNRGNRMEVDNIVQETFAFFENESRPISANIDVNTVVDVVDKFDFSIDELPESELTELVCDDTSGALYSLLPSLARLSEENRWITLVSPPANLDEKLFAAYGIDPSRVLLIHPKDSSQNTSVMNKALKNGKSGIVVYWSDKVPARFLAQWRKSVKQGSCIGVWVNLGGRPSASRSIAVTMDVKTASKYVKVKKIKEYGIASFQRSEIVLPRINTDFLIGSRELRMKQHH